MSDRTEETMAAALEPFGWVVGPEFWERYYSDPWVFNFANAIERLTEQTAAAEARIEAFVDWTVDTLNYPFDFSTDPPIPEPLRTLIEDAWVKRDGGASDDEDRFIRQITAEEGRWAALTGEADDE